MTGNSAVVVQTAIQLHAVQGRSSGSPAHHAQRGARKISLAKAPIARLLRPPSDNGRAVVSVCDVV
jgi:hypothetical protein